MMPTQDLFLAMIDAFMAKDLKRAMSYFAEDAVLIDPHYPKPRMKGLVDIERGLTWGLSSLAKPGFALRNSSVNGDLGFFEMDTQHVLTIGITIAFDQVFVVEARDGKIVRLQAYEPYPAPGIAGVIRRATWVSWRLRGWV